MKKLFLFALVIASCSRKDEALLYKEGREAESRKNYQLAAERFEDIVDRFPSRPYAESSLVRLADIYTNGAKDVPKAVRAYRRYYLMFPESKQAPTMLFLSGFLYNNDLHQLDSARSVYEIFLSHYPHHELAASAKFELETLGKDPGAALEPRVSSGDSGRAGRQ